MRRGADEDARLTYLVAAHDCGPFLGDCLASLAAQTDPRWLAIVADDASTDDSQERIRSLLEPRIRLLVNERRLGYVATLRRLLDEARTDVVAVLDADDALEPHATAALIEAYDRHPDASLVYSCFAEYDTALAVCRGAFGGPVPPGGTAIIDGPVGAIRSFRRSAYARTTGLDSSMQGAEDRDLVYKLEELAPPVFVNSVLYRYRVVPGSQSHDPRLREIGLQNARRARRAALTRRRVRGTARLVARCAIEGDYLASSRRFPALIRAPASIVYAASAFLWRQLGSGPPR